MFINKCKISIHYITSLSTVAALKLFHLLCFINRVLHNLYQSSFINQISVSRKTFLITIHIHVHVAYIPNVTLFAEL